MHAGDTDLPDDGVRQALARLGTDSASAGEVPAAVTARIGAALRAAPPPAHSATARLRPLRVVALVAGIGALLGAVALALAALHDAPGPRFPAGPTADRITVSSNPAYTPNSMVTRP